MPHTIARRKGIFTIYTAAEADGAGIEFVPLREITSPTAETGLWALTDDGFAAECLGRKEYTDGRGSTKTCLRLTFGCVWVPRHKPFCFMPFFKAGHYGGTSPTSWIDKEARTRRARRTVKAYVAMSLSPTGLNWDRLGRIYRPNQNNPAKTVRKLLREEKIQAMIRTEMRMAFTGGHITLEEITVMYRTLLEATMQGKDYAIAKELLNVFRQWLGL